MVNNYKRSGVITVSSKTVTSQ